MKRIRIPLTLSLCLIAFFALTVSSSALECADLNNDGIHSTDDAVLALRYSSGLAVFDDECINAADIVHDGTVDSKDVVEILRIAADISEPPPHRYSEWEITTAPTCTSTGTEECFCTVCGEYFYGTVPKISHDYDNNVCKICGEKEYEPSVAFNGTSVEFGSSPADVRTAMGSPNDILTDRSLLLRDITVYIYCDDYSNLRIFTFTDNELTQFYSNSFHSRVFQGTDSYCLESASADIGTAVVGFEISVTQYIDSYADNGEYVYAYLATVGDEYTFSDYTDRAVSQKLVFHITNSLRAINGKEILIYSPAASDVAYNHSLDMATRGYFDHYTPEGKSPGDRITEGGIECYGWGENIAAGYTDAYCVSDGWYNSQGHRANLLSDQHTHLGVGIARDLTSSYRYYSTQNFYTYY